MPAAADVARTSLLLIFAFAGIEMRTGAERRSARHGADSTARDCARDGGDHRRCISPCRRSRRGLSAAGLAQATVSPLADTAAALGWQVGRGSLLLSGATLSMFGYLGGMTLSMPRMVFALARDGFLPRALAAVHPRHRSPQAAIIAQSLLTLALAIFRNVREARHSGQRLRAGVVPGLRAGGLATETHRRHRRRGGRRVSGSRSRVWCRGWRARSSCGC